MTPTPPETGPDVSANQARQGGSGKRILMLLVVSAVAAVVILGLVFVFASPKLENSTDGEAGAAPTAAYDQA